MDCPNNCIVITLTNKVYEASYNSGSSNRHSSLFIIWNMYNIKVEHKLGKKNTMKSRVDTLSVIASLLPNVPGT